MIRMSLSTDFRLMPILKCSQGLYYCSNLKFCMRICIILFPCVLYKSASASLIIRQVPVQVQVELQWLEHLWDHEIMFETGVILANEC